MAALCREFLGIEHVGAADDFFRLGGDSLLAIRMLAAVEDAFGVSIAFPDFVEAPTVEAVAIAVAAGTPSTAPVTSPSGATETAGGTAPCTPAQERLWFIEEMAPGLGVYNMPLGVRLRGALDVDALLRSLQEVVQRHGALRTRFTPDADRLLQVVDTTAGLDLTRHDLRSSADPEADARRLADELVSQPFSLERDLPARGALFRLREDDHVLQLVFHHIVCDGWSHVVFFRELGALYSGYTSGEPTVLPPRLQYEDFARRTPAATDERIGYWRDRLADAPLALELPTDRPRPVMPTYRGKTRRTKLPPELSAAVRAFARAEGATVFTTLLAVYYVLLHRLSGQNGVNVGATVSGRDHSELEDAIGLYANTVVLAADLEGAPTFRTLLAQVRATVSGALAYQDVPFEVLVAELQPERDLSRHPIFQVFFAQVPHAPLEIEGAEPFDAQLSTSRFDITLFVEEESDEQLDLVWEYATDLFDDETIAGFEAHYLELLHAALDDAEQSVERLPMLAPEARRELIAAPDAQEFAIGCLHELFAQRVAASPDAPAVTFEGTTISYRELDARANAVAHRLRAVGVGRETLVALCLERSSELVIAILGVLKAGGAYVPLDPEYPADRLAYVLEDSGAPVLLTQERLLERLPAHDAQTLCLDTEPAHHEETLEAPPSVSRPEDLAYVIYTSGSTGRPKGVQVEHRQVARLFTATEAWFNFSASDTWLLFHSYAFDFSVWELWGPLLYGGRLVVPPHWTTRSPELLAELLVAEGVTVMNATPSAFLMAMTELLDVADDLKLRFVVFGGEALRPLALKPWFERMTVDGPTLVNMYGITETTVHVTYRPLTASDAEQEASPIGRPIPDLQLYVLDALLEPVPPGVPGELFVGGAGVARGYLHRPELTAERFLSNPFGAGRLYRSGDRVRRRADGEIEFLGRLDDQVKIRGFRIELGEIEAALAEHEAVSKCVVRAVEASPGDNRLAAWFVPAAPAGDGDQTALRDAVWATLDEKLPPFMVPSSLALLDTLPLTPNGKLDVRALSTPVWERGREDEAAGLRTETETRIADIWCKVLGIDTVAPGDSFFNLGGHSLLAARVVTQIRESFEIKVSVRAIFEHPTLGAFAAHIDALSSEASPASEQSATAPEPASHRSHYPLSANQQQLLFFEELDPGGSLYNAGLAIAVSGPLQRELLEQAIKGVMQRHEALRTVFVRQNEVAEQLVLERWNVELPLIDLSALPDDERERELHRLLREHSLRTFDLAAEPMLRTALFRLDDEAHVVLFQPHHIAVDGWSVDILYREVQELYDAAVEGRNPNLPELTLQYRDFAVWQRQRLQGRRLDDELEYWRTALAGAPTFLPLPADRPRPAVQRYEGATHEVLLDRELAQTISSLAREEGVTPYMLLLGVFGTLLYRVTGRDDILLGGPFANRSRPEFEQLVGYFANTLVVRLRLAGNPDFRELLTRAREATLEVLDHQELSFEAIVEAVRPPREVAANPLFQVNFRVRVDAAPTLELAGTTTQRIPLDLGLARFDLALELHVHQDGVLAQFNYDSALFDAQTVERLAEDFVGLLRQVLARPETRLLDFHVSFDSGAASVPAGPESIRRFRATRSAATDPDPVG